MDPPKRAGPRMNWLILSPGQVVLLSSAAAAFALWIYLHQRPSRRRVSTLRFWADLPASAYRRRRWLREPWAFLAQVLFLIFVVTALANPRWGVAGESRRVVMVLDTSIWSQVQPTGEVSWIDRVRQEANQILRELPATDQVLLLRADAASAPILPFTQDRLAQAWAIAQVRTSASIADVPRALEAGRAALAGSRRGLLIYIGPGMIDDRQARQIKQFRQALDPIDGSGEHPQFLIRLVGGAAPVENRGITRLALQRDETQPDLWHVLTQVKNYGQTNATLRFQLALNGQPVSRRAVSVAPSASIDLRDEFISDQGGVLQAQISPADALQADDRFIVDVPPFNPIRVAVFTASSSFEKELHPILSANPYLRTEFSHPGIFPAEKPEVAIYDNSASLPSQPAMNSIYFVRGHHKPASGPVRLTNWDAQHPVTRWVHTRDVSVRNPALLDVLPGDTVLASSEQQPPMPLIVARERKGRKILMIGFDPLDSNLPQQPAFPLLMAGAVEWLGHPVVDHVNSLSTGELDLPVPAVRIVGPSGRDIPFARNAAGTHLLALDPGAYRVIGASGATTFEVNTPSLLPSQKMKPTAAETSPVEPEAIQNRVKDLWPWLVVLAAIALWAEWWLFYSVRLNRTVASDGKARSEVHDLKYTI